MADDDYERIVLVKPEVFMYRIPPRTTNRAYRYALKSFFNTIQICILTMWTLIYHIFWDLFAW